METDVIRNRRIKPRHKIAPESIENGEEHLVALKAAIAEAEVILSNLDGNPGWVALCRNWEGQLAEIEERLDDFQNLTDKGRDFLLKERQDIKTLLSTLESIEAKATTYRTGLMAATAKLNASKERLGTIAE